jgi:hypothetical protein
MINPIYTDRPSFFGRREFFAPADDALLLGHGGELLSDAGHAVRKRREQEKFMAEEEGDADSHVRVFDTHDDQLFFWAS